MQPLPSCNASVRRHLPLFYPIPCFTASSFEVKSPGKAGKKVIVVFSYRSCIVLGKAVLVHTKLVIFDEKQVLKGSFTS